uniref:Uncharacterized protein n=1 Tax=Ailuropoda melanoleuca TaxID=9646 RepID=A0A7N5KAR0_AILME
TTLWPNTWAICLPLSFLNSQLRYLNVINASRSFGRSAPTKNKMSEDSLAHLKRRATLGRIN